MQLPDLEDLLRQTYIFGTMAAADMSALERAFALHVYEPGETIVRAGQPRDAWHIVCSGRARIVTSQGAPPLPFARGDAFGERALVDDGAWGITVRAETAATLLLLTRERYGQFAAGVARETVQAVERRIAAYPEFEFLKRLRVFSHLGPGELERLLDAAGRRAVEAGERVFVEDEAADRCYVVRRGRVQLLARAGQSHKQLAIRRSGDLLGELELLYGTPRMADAVALDPSELIVIDHTLFDAVMPEGGAREVIFQQATERLLQFQNVLAAADREAGSERLPALAVEWTTAAGGFLPAHYPVVRTDMPVVAGLACLAMLDAAATRESAWQDRLEQLLWEREPDTLVSLSRKAEECGYVTRLVAPGLARLASAGAPGVVTDEDGSLAVLHAASADGVVLANPATGLRRVARDAFGAWWDGNLLLVEAAARPFHARLLDGHRRALASVAIAALAVQLLGLGQPLAAKLVIDRVLVNGDRSLLGLLALVVAIMAVLQLLATALRNYLLAHASGRITLALQRRFLKHVLGVPQRLASASAIGPMAVRFHDNEPLVERALSTGVAVVVDTLTLLVALVTLWAISGLAVTVAAGFAVAYAGVTLAAAPFLRRRGAQRLDARQAVESHLIETISGIQTVKTLAAEPIVFERGRKLMARLRAEDFDGGRLAAHVEIGGTVLHLAAMVTMLAVGARLAIAGSMSTGDIVASLGVLGVAFGPLKGLVQARSAVREVRASAQSLTAVSDLPVEGSTAGAVPPLIKGHVLFNDVTFRYPGSDEDALSGIDLEVLPGQTVALVGRSGSGKTTLANLIAGLYPPTSGSLYIDHVDVTSFPKEALRRQLGVVEQHPFLFEGTIRANIARQDLAVPMERVSAVATLAGVHDFIASLPAGYDTPVGERGGALSGGERQRLMIARALVAAPRMLILDEATSAIDSASEREIHQSIASAVPGRTTFIIAHRLSTIRHADVIVVLDRGRIIERGTHAQLMARRGLYYYLSTRAA